MVVLILESASIGLRGELSRWMIEPRAGVFVGTVSPMVRDKLWERINVAKSVGGGILIYRSPTEQGFTVRTCGDPSRTLANFEGLTLVRISEARKKANDDEELDDTAENGV